MQNAAGLLLAQDGNHRFGDIDGAEKIGVDLFSVNVNRRVFKCSWNRIAGIVDNNIDAAKFLDCSLDGALDLVVVDNVERQRQDAVRSILLNKVLHRVRVSGSSNDVVAISEDGFDNGKAEALG